LKNDCENSIQAQSLPKKSSNQTVSEIESASRASEISRFVTEQKGLNDSSMASIVSDETDKKVNHIKTLAMVQGLGVLE
jgi:hypothetical protein